MKLKTLLGTLLIFCFSLLITACSGNIARPIIDETEITLWTYPVGDWGNKETVTGLIQDFTELHPEISVKFKLLDYNYGDKEIDKAVKAGKAPDVVIEGPERLVANWGKRGLMADLSDMYTDASRDIYENVALACRSNNGKYYEYPLCMATHCMAINKKIFEEANALQYVNVEEHTWTTENFFNAINAIYEQGHENVLTIYCNGQSGDQGSRALINNLYGGTYTDNLHQYYTIDSTKNVAALTALLGHKGITIDPELTSDEEIAKFRNGELAMSICWNPSTHGGTEELPAGKTVDGDEIIPMHFPSPDGHSKLVGGIWGFGIFNNGSSNKIKAAKLFIDFMANDENEVKKAVKASRFFPVHKGIGDIYDDTDIEKTMQLFSKNFMLSMGDYYQVTPGWTEVRSLWWKALQEISKGQNIKVTLAECNTKANEIAERIKANYNTIY